MGLVYAPNQPIGKGATSGNLRFFNPRLAGGFGRAGTIIKGAEAVARFAFRHRKFFTGVGSVATGAGIQAGSTGIDLDGSTNNQFRKTNSSGNFNKRSGKYRRKRQYRYRATRSKCCCTIKRSRRKYR